MLGRQIMSETEEAPVTEVNGIDLSKQQLAIAIENHLRAVAVGLVVTNPNVRQDVMWEAIAAGMGRVLSAATMWADIKASLDARGRLQDIVARNIRKGYPAVDKAAVAAAAANSNGKLGGIILPH